MQLNLDCIVKFKVWWLTFHVWCFHHIPFADHANASLCEIYLNTLMSMCVMYSLLTIAGVSKLTTP